MCCCAVAVVASPVVSVQGVATPDRMLTQPAAGPAHQPTPPASASRPASAALIPPPPPVDTNAAPVRSVAPSPVPAAAAPTAASAALVLTASEPISVIAAPAASAPVAAPSAQVQSSSSAVASSTAGTHVATVAAVLPVVPAPAPVGQSPPHQTIGPITSDARAQTTTPARTVTSSGFEDVPHADEQHARGASGLLTPQSAAWDGVSGGPPSRSMSYFAHADSPLAEPAEDNTPAATSAPEFAHKPVAAVASTAPAVRPTARVLDAESKHHAVMAPPSRDFTPVPNRVLPQSSSRKPSSVAPLPVAKKAFEDATARSVDGMLPLRDLPAIAEQLGAPLDPYFTEVRP